MAERPLYVYRLVIDQPATVWPTYCWRCDAWAEGADLNGPHCMVCGLNLNPRLIGGHRRNFLARPAAEKRATMVRAAGGLAHVERSEAVEWVRHG